MFKGLKLRNNDNGKEAEIVEVVTTEGRYGDKEETYILSDNRKRSLTAGEVRAHYRKIAGQQPQTMNE